MRASLAAYKPDLIIDPECEVQVDRMHVMKARHPWRKDVSGPRNRPITVPDFMAYCCVAAALRPYARPNRALFAIVLVEGDDVESYIEGAMLYLRQLGGEYADSWLKTTSDRRFERTVDELLERPIDKRYALIVVSDKHVVSDRARLFSDALVRVSRPTDRQIITAFARFGHSLAERDLRMIAAESWGRLRLAFLPGRTVAAGLHRLRAEPPLSDPSNPDAAVNGPTLHDLHGLGEAAKWGLELAQDLADYAAGRIDWSDVDAGVLVSGPPGTGKTMFAEALARTCKVPLVVGSAARWQAEGHLGDFLRAMRESFQEAKSKSPAIIFVDEVDAFGDRNVDRHNSDYKRQAINGFLEHLDGIDRRRGLVVVAATNHPEALDPAIRRPGRLGRHIVIEKPDPATRLKIVEQYAGIPISVEHLERFTRTTGGMTGADLSLLIRDAKRAARRRSVALAAEHIMGCLPKLRPLSADTLRRTAIHETGHAIVGLMLGLGPLEAVVIRDDITEGAIESVGRTRFREGRGEGQTRSSYLSHISTLLAGMAAEELELGEPCDAATGGEDSDLGRATAIATLVEAGLGLGSTLVVEPASEERLSHLRVRNREVRAAIDVILTEQYARARKILDEHRTALREIAEELLKTRHLQGGAVAAIIQRHQARSDMKLNERADYPGEDLAVPMDGAVNVACWREESNEREICDRDNKI